MLRVLSIFRGLTGNLNNSPSNTNSNVGFRCVFFAAGRLERKKRVKDAYEIYQGPLFSFNGKFLKALRLFSGAHCKRGFFISPFAESESKNLNGEESTISFGCGAARRGGNWNNGSIGGAFSMNLNNSPSNTSTNIGFRCVFLAAGRLGEYKWRKIFPWEGPLDLSLGPQGTTAFFPGPPTMAIFGLRRAQNLPVTFSQLLDVLRKKQEILFDSIGRP